MMKTTGTCVRGWFISRTDRQLPFLVLLAMKESLVAFVYGLPTCPTNAIVMGITRAECRENPMGKQRQWFLVLVLLLEKFLKLTRPRMGTLNTCAEQGHLSMDENCRRWRFAALCNKRPSRMNVLCP